MSYPRVNLLKKSEQRYQGSVSGRLLSIGGVVIPVLFIVIFSTIKLIQYTSAKSNLESGKATWATLEPQLELYKKEESSLSANRQALDLISGWQGTRIPLSELLSEVQGSVPTSVQLTRLALRSDPGTSSYEKKDDFVLDYTLIVQGVAHGERAEDIVIDLRKNLLKTEQMKSVFNSVKLISMRKRTGGEGEAMREFSLHGAGAEGGDQ